MTSKDPFQAAIEAAEKARVVRPPEMKAADVPKMIEEWRAVWHAEDPAFALGAILESIAAIAILAA